MNCLKCGRTVPEKTLLCPECLRASKAAAAPKPMELPQEEILQANLKKQSHRVRRLRRGVAILVIFGILCAAALGFTGYYAIEQHRRLSTQISRINSLETVMEEQKAELEQAAAANAALRDSLSEQEAALDAYQTYTGLTPEEILSPPPEEPEQ